MLYVTLTGTLLVNQAYVLYWLNAYYPNAGPNLTGDPVVLAVSVINLLMLAYASILMWYELKGRGWLKPEPATLSQHPAGRRAKINLKLKITKTRRDNYCFAFNSFLIHGYSEPWLNPGPTTTAQLTAGQSFYLDLGSSTERKISRYPAKAGRHERYQYRPVHRTTGRSHNQHCVAVIGFK